LLSFFVVGELMVYIVYKLMRRDFLCWMRVDGKLAVIISIFYRLLVKVILDYSGCLLLRLPNELGGFAFSVSMLWAQMFPFVALQLYTSEDENEDEDEMKDNVRIFLICSFALWLLLYIAFFALIKIKYVNTFFSTQTAGQYACEWFQTADDDQGRFGAAFYNRISFKKPIERDVKEWVANNIAMWKEIRPDWFIVEKIPDEFLPDDVFEAVGGSKRRRSSIRVRESLREFIGVTDVSTRAAIANRERSVRSNRVVVPMSEPEPTQAQA